MPAKERINAILSKKLKKTAMTFAKKEGWTLTRLLEESLGYYMSVNNNVNQLIEEHRESIS